MNLNTFNQGFKGQAALGYNKANAWQGNNQSQAAMLNMGLQSISAIGDSMHDEYADPNIENDDYRLKSRADNISKAYADARNQEAIGDTIGSAANMGLSMANPVLGMVDSGLGAVGSMIGMDLAPSKIAGNTVADLAEGDMSGVVDDLTLGLSSKLGLKTNTDKRIDDARNEFDTMKRAYGLLDGRNGAKGADYDNRRKADNTLNAVGYGINSRGINPTSGNGNQYAMNQNYQFANYAEGGYMQGSPGSTLIENGGSHEMNPMGGIPVGMSGGKPAMLEEGEVKWDNYVFSDRLYAE